MPTNKHGSNGYDNTFNYVSMATSRYRESGYLRWVLSMRFPCPT